jgi:hypothetical protein
MLVSDRCFNIIRQASQQIESSNHDSVLLAQALIPAAKDLDFLAFYSKLLQQSDCLTVSRPKYTRSPHALASMTYIMEHTRRFPAATNLQLGLGRLKNILITEAVHGGRPAVELTIFNGP